MTYMLFWIGCGIINIGCTLDEGGLNKQQLIEFYSRYNIEIIEEDK